MNGNHRTVGLVPAAGLARRLGISSPKELLPVGGRPVIDYSIDHLVEAGVGEIVVVIRSGKEAILDHLSMTYQDIEFTFVYQEGEIGNLIDAIKTARDELKGSTVLFLMPDTVISPNPFRQLPRSEVTLLCFEAAGDSWRNFGVVSPEQGEIIDKPETFVGRVCWGALAWRPSFTERLMAHELLPDALNDAEWSYEVAIEDYRDIGTGEDGDAIDSTR